MVVSITHGLVTKIHRLEILAFYLVIVIQRNYVLAGKWNKILTTCLLDANFWSEVLKDSEIDTERLSTERFSTGVRFSIQNLETQD